LCLSWGNIFRIENPGVWKILMFSQIFPMRNMGRLCTKCVQIVYCCLKIS
jgi:hypothetical protein